MDSSKLKRYRLSENALFKAYQLEPKEEKITIDKFATLLRVQTIGHGAPLLFVHGAPNAGSTWAQLVSFLSGYKCILIDRPGCGLSTAINYEDISPTYVKDLIVSVMDGVLDYFKIDRAPVIASSFGGYLVLLYTVHRSSRISKLIFEGCPAMVEGSGLPPFMKIMFAPFLNKIIPRLPTTKSFFKSYWVNLDMVIQWIMALFRKCSLNGMSVFLIIRIHRATICRLQEKHFMLVI